MQRTTLKAPLRFAGTGLFSAQPCAITLHPSHEHCGIVFEHMGQRIPAHIDALSSVPVHPAFASMSPRCTGVGSDQINIATIEHLLSALCGLGISDALIVIESTNAHCEIPILDGSAIDFVSAINTSGIETLDTTINPITITERIVIEDDDASITIEPNETPSYTYTLDYPQPEITNASVTWDGDASDYAERIAHARTFCLEHEADAMHSAGLFTHLSTSDMLVISKAGPIDNTLRDPHECALHKLLDLIGDLALVGRPLHAKVHAIKSGHRMAHQAARAIIEQQS